MEYRGSTLFSFKSGTAASWLVHYPICRSERPWLRRICLTFLTTIGLFSLSLGEPLPALAGASTPSWRDIDQTNPLDLEVAASLLPSQLLASFLSFGEMMEIGPIVIARTKELKHCRNNDCLCFILLRARTEKNHNSTIAFRAGRSVLLADEVGVDGENFVTFQGGSQVVTIAVHDNFLLVSDIRRVLPASDK
jgi:hypothetical protein